MQEVLGVVLLVGAAQLVSTGSAVPDICDEDAVKRCLQPLNSNTLRNISASELNDTDSISLHDWEHACSAMERAMGCVEWAEHSCIDMDDRETNLTDLLSLDFDVPRLFQLQPLYQAMCTEKMQCMLTVNQDKAKELCTGAEDCRTDLECFMEMIKDNKKCLAVNDLADMHKNLTLKRGICEQDQCQQLKMCPQAPTAISSDTCRNFTQYVQCAASIMPSAEEDQNTCPMHAFLQQGQLHDTLTALVPIFTEACTATEKPGIAPLFNCLSFQLCIVSVMRQDLSGTDITYLPNICPMVQDFIGCAVRTVETCEGVNQTLTADFKKNGIHLAYQIQRVGCANANVFADSCTELQNCRTSFLSSQSPPRGFSDMCKRVVWYQKCASRAVENCKGPFDEDTRTAISVEMPHLKDLANATMRLCNVMEGLDLAGCDEFLECANTLVPPLEPGWRAINGQAWCEFNIRMVLCLGSFSRTCRWRAFVTEEATDVYNALMAQGCHDPFDYMTTTSSGVSPGQSLITVGLMIMVVMATSVRV